MSRGIGRGGRYGDWSDREDLIQRRKTKIYSQDCG